MSSKGGPISRREGGVGIIAGIVFFYIHIDMPTMPTYGGKGGLMTRILRYMYKLQTTGVPWTTLYTLYNKSL